jgi:hypothetical protein
MKARRLQSTEVLNFPSSTTHHGTVRRWYEEWRRDHGRPERCDNPACILHDPLAVRNGEKLRMILDHISGNCEDNRPQNLRLLCPNCASQLATHGGRNIGRIDRPTKRAYHERHRNGRQEATVSLEGVSAESSVAPMGVIPATDKDDA